MVLQIHAQSISKPSELWTRRQEVIFIIFKELFDLFFEGCLKKPLDPALGLLTLFSKFFGLLVFLSILFLDHIWNLVHQPHFFIVIKIGVNLISDCNQGHWRFTKSIAQNVHIHDGLIPFKRTVSRLASLAYWYKCKAQRGQTIPHRLNLLETRI